MSRTPRESCGTAERVRRRMCQQVAPESQRKAVPETRHTWERIGPCSRSATKCNQTGKSTCKLLKMVARDGIEPPPPAFSGLYSSVGKSFIPRNMSMLSRLQTIELLEPIGTSISSLVLKAPSGYRPLYVGSQVRTADKYPRSYWPWNAASAPEHLLRLHRRS